MKRIHVVKQTDGSFQPENGLNRVRASQLLQDQIMNESQQKAKEEQEDYKAAVKDFAENLVYSLENYDKGEWKERFQILLDDKLDLEPYVIDEDLNILTLIYSDFPCAGIVDGTSPNSKKLDNDSKRAFPFQQFAYDAFEEDVKVVAFKLLEEQGIDLNDDQYNNSSSEEDEEDTEDE